MPPPLPSSLGLPVSTREFSLFEMVSRAWGSEFFAPDHRIYQFGGVRFFDSTDMGTTGIYRRGQCTLLLDDNTGYDGDGSAVNDEHGHYICSDTGSSSLPLPPVPLPPVLAASPLGGAVLLTWTMPPLSFAAPVASYLVYRETGGGGFTLLATVGSFPLQYTDNTVTGGNGYSYYVVAVDDLGRQTGPSNIVSASGTFVDVYSVPGTFTWTKRPGALTVGVLAIAAGGGGGSGQNFFSSGTPGGGGGGAGGGYAQVLGIDATQLTDTVTVTVGQGGAGALAGTQLVGSSGTTTSFGSYIVATGGGPGAGADEGDSGPGGTAAVSGITGTITTAQGGQGGGGTNQANPGNDGKDATPAPGGGGSGFSREPESNVTAGNGGACGALAGGVGGFNPGTPIPNGNPGAPGNSGGYDSGSGGGGGGNGGGLFGDTLGGDGGAGGLYGAGGGGGGLAASIGGPPEVAISGAGGDGASGVVVVTTALW